VVACTVAWWRRRRRRSIEVAPPSLDLDSVCKKLKALDDPDATEPPQQLSPPVDGFLVAAVQPEEGFGGFIPEDTDAEGPPSTDDDDEEDAADKLNRSFVSFRGKREEREGSFRQRSTDKVERAQTIKAKSASLYSHLCTPAQHNRRVDLQIARSPTAQPPPGSRTVVTSHRHIDVNSEGSTPKKRPDLEIPGFGKARPSTSSEGTRLATIEASPAVVAVARTYEPSVLAAESRASMASNSKGSQSKGQALPETTLPTSTAESPFRNTKKGKSLAGFDSLSGGLSKKQ